MYTIPTHTKHTGAWRATAADSADSLDNRRPGRDCVLGALQRRLRISRLPRSGCGESAAIASLALPSGGTGFCVTDAENGRPRQRMRHLRVPMAEPSPGTVGSRRSERAGSGGVRSQGGRPSEDSRAGRWAVAADPGEAAAGRGGRVREGRAWGRVEQGQFFT